MQRPFAVATGRQVLRRIARDRRLSLLVVKIGSALGLAGLSALGHDAPAQRVDRVCEQVAQDRARDRPLLPLIQEACARRVRERDFAPLVMRTEVGRRQVGRHQIVAELLGEDDAVAI